MNAKEEATARLIHGCDKHHEHEIYRCPECKRFNLDIEIEREPVWHCHSGCSKEVIQNAFYDLGLWASKIEIKAAKSDLDFPLLRANGITAIKEALDEECYDARWLTDNEPEPRDWTIKPILPAKELSGLTGPPGSGKTFSAIMMGLGVARGEFNGSPCKKANVMYVTREESLAEIHRRIKT
ncbi:AAA family ATPase [Luminiphilus sp.]|nr:AAA family ATPase [Luminiphilus sp.]